MKIIILFLFTFIISCSSDMANAQIKHRTNTSSTFYEPATISDESGTYLATVNESKTIAINVETGTTITASYNYSTISGTKISKRSVTVTKEITEDVLWDLRYPDK